MNGGFAAETIDRSGRAPGAGKITKEKKKKKNQRKTFNSFVPNQLLLEKSSIIW
jgi:hypothetical protein